MENLEEYGLWVHLKAIDEKEEVMWWASVDDVPDDVFEFLLFVMSTYRDLGNAFRTMDRNRRGSISFDEFHAEVHRVGCKRFEVALKHHPLKSKAEREKDEDEAEEKRLRSVFSYLDTGGEGALSVHEFFLLQEMWQEVRLSIIQFLGFLDRMFAGSLRAAWNYFDKGTKDVGEIGVEKWRKVCEQSGYCGPVKPIWRFLDYNDNGVVTFKEFRLLEQFRGELNDRECFRILRVARDKLLEGVPENPEE